MTLEEIVIGLVRLLGALPVLRWPFWGGLLTIAVDFSDLFWMNWLQLGGLRDYQTFDKLADLPTLLAFLWVSRRWRPAPRRIAVGLFAFRMVGVAVFLATDRREVLLAFPNVFEAWFLFVAAKRRFRPKAALSSQATAAWLFVLTSAKLLQEYVLHRGRWLDNYVATEVAAEIWRWLVGR